MNMFFERSPITWQTLQNECFRLLLWAYPERQKNTKLDRNETIGGIGQDLNSYFPTLQNTKLKYMCQCHFSCLSKCNNVRWGCAWLKTIYTPQNEIESVNRSTIKLLQGNPNGWQVWSQRQSMRDRGIWFCCFLVDQATPLVRVSRHRDGQGPRYIPASPSLNCTDGTRILSWKVPNDHLL